MDRSLLRKYAEVVVRKGINLYQGQCASILAGPDDLAFALILESELYRLGAKYVELSIKSNTSIKSRIDYAEETSLDFVPSYVQAEINERIANDWAYIRIDNTGENRMLSTVDPSRLDTVFKSGRIARKRLLEVCSKHLKTWCVIAAPNAKWAADVSGLPPGPEADDALDKVLVPILRLDQRNPATAWEVHAKRLAERAETLDQLRIDTLIFENSTSSLEIGLTPKARWEGGGDITPDGRRFLPNIPTEEVFTTPDFRRTFGRIHCTRPVSVMETELKGVWFEFKAGEVVDFGADENRAVLENFLATDSGARRLGEVALVDKRSPIYQSKLVFGSILYDENASCHIALGRGYPSCLTGGTNLKTDAELNAARCNTSLVHTDFMVGSDDLSVVARSIDGNETTIIKDGLFEI